MKNILIKKKNSFKEFYKKMKKNKTSQVNYLEKLLEDKKITKEDFINNITNVDNYLKELIDKKIITKEDYYDNILLPLKFGTVSLANKTNSKIVPYAITGDYKLRTNNLKIIIGKPIEPQEDLAKANEKLDKAMKDLIKKIS